jgi:ABC-type transporter Mla subunit MlaD
MSTAESIQLITQVAAELPVQVENAAEKLDIIQNKLSEYQEQVGTKQSETEALITSLLEATSKLESQIAAKIQESSGLLETVESDFNDLNSLIEAGSSVLQAAIEGIRQGASELQDLAASRLSELVGFRGSMSEFSAGLQQSLSSHVDLFQEMQEQIEEQGDRFQSIMEESQEQLQQTYNLVEEGLSNAVGDVTSLLTLFNSDNKNSKEWFDEILRILVTDKVTQMFEDLKSDATEKINAEVNQIIDECVERLSEVIRNAGTSMISRGEESDAARKVVEAVIDELDPLVSTVKDLYDRLSPTFK